MAQAIIMHKFMYNADTAHEDFPDWLFLFENFLQISEIDVTKQPGAVSAKQHLIHGCGALAVKMIKAMDKPEEATYAQLKAALEAYCAPKDKNTMMFKFDQLKQQSNESIREYVYKLKSLATAAGITTANAQGEILRRIRQNTNAEDTRLKAMESEMTVEKLLLWETARMAQQTCTQIASGSKSYDINYVSNAHANKRKHSDNGNAQSSKKERTCFHCGKEFPHKGGKCPAFGKNCDNCGTANHFASVCRREKKDGQARSNNGGNWKGVNQQNSNNKFNTNKKIYNVIEKHLVTTEEPKEDTLKLFKQFYGWLNSGIDDEGNPLNNDSE
jgi:hypothetical protein